MTLLPTSYFLLPTSYFLLFRDLVPLANSQSICSNRCIVTTKKEPYMDPFLEVRAALVVVSALLLFLVGLGLS